MSKAKEEVKEIKEVKEVKQKYALSSAILRQGYEATIDGRHFKIGFDVNFAGQRQDEFASVMKQIENPERGGGVKWKSTGVYTLEDLSDSQLWQLAHAKVISMNKEQDKIFMEKFYKK